MKVLHVGKYYPPHPGGMETHIKALCAELKSSVDVEIIVANDSGNTAEELIDGIKVTRLGKAFDLAAAPVCPRMVRKIRETKAEIVHIHYPNPTAILSYLASGHKGRLIIGYHSDIVRQKFLGKAFWPFLKRALDRASAIIVATPNHIASSPILRPYGKLCRVVPYVISLEAFKRTDHAEVEDIRKNFGPRIVLAVGRLVYYKGFEYLIRAMRHVRGRLLIVGNGPLRRTLAEEASAHDITDRVFFLSEVKEVSPFYHAADVFVLSSVARSEAFGIVQLEAMACGKPVVNTNLDSGVPFVSLHGVSGLTVPPADPLALGRAINNLLNDPARSHELGMAGRKRVEEEFSLATMTNRTLEVYREVVGS